MLRERLAFAVLRALHPARRRVARRALVAQELASADEVAEFLGLPDAERADLVHHTGRVDAKALAESRPCKHEVVLTLASWSLAPRRLARLLDLPCVWRARGNTVCFVSSLVRVEFVVHVLKMADLGGDVFDLALAQAHHAHVARQAVYQHIRNSRLDGARASTVVRLLLQTGISHAAEALRSDLLLASPAGFAHAQTALSIVREGGHILDAVALRAGADAEVRLGVRGDRPPFRVHMSEVRALPAGLNFDGAAIHGRPLEAGKFAPIVVARDAVGACACAEVRIVVYVNPPHEGDWHPLGMAVKVYVGDQWYVGRVVLVERERFTERPYRVRLTSGEFEGCMCWVNIDKN